MSLQSKLSGLERRANFAPRSPCPMCELSARSVREWVALVGDRAFWGAGVTYSYGFVCRFCGLAETRQGNAPDEETARLFAGVLNALAESQFCEVENLDLSELHEVYERAARECLGADFPRWRALGDEYGRGVREIHAEYRPRVPYDCRSAACTCSPEWMRGAA